MKSLDNNLDPKLLSSLVDKTVSHYDDGELFIEKTVSEHFSYDNNKLKTASFDTEQGFGLRVINGDKTGFSHSTDLNIDSIKNSIRAVKSVKSGKNIFLALPQQTNKKLYSDSNPIELKEFRSKVSLLEKINAYARKLGNNVSQVSITLAGNYQKVQIFKINGQIYTDSRPLVRLNVSLTVKNKHKIETGS